MAADTIDAFRSANYEIAEAIAPTWERRRADIEEASTAGPRVDAARARGRGRATRCSSSPPASATPASTRPRSIGERGRLITTDFSPSMLEAARRRGAERGVDNVEYRVIDAERIELDADSVDGVLCRFGYMLMADPAAALARDPPRPAPGGRLALAVWGALERNPFFGIVGMSLGRRGHLPPPEPPPAPGPFSMASAERTAALLEGAGFSEVRTEEVPVRLVAAGRRRVPEPGRRHRRPARARAAGAARGRARRDQGGRRGRVRALRGRARLRAPRRRPVRGGELSAARGGVRCGGARRSRRRRRCRPWPAAGPRRRRAPSGRDRRAVAAKSTAVTCHPRAASHSVSDP